jgi:hypothetical protein
MWIAWLACGAPTVEPPVAVAAPETHAEPPTVAPVVAVARAPAPGRVVAIGDLHGDLSQAMKAFQLAGVTDAAGRWTGGDATLVQTGDVLDRGPDGKPLLDWLIRLQEDARTSGGVFKPLLGNHEAMNTRGDLRYVSDGDVQGFGGADARRQALSPSGTYGNWLATLDTVAVIGDTVFCHGGLTEAFAAQGVDAVNREVRASLFSTPLPAAGPEGPQWYRGFAQDDEEVACPRLERSLRALGASRMVVGHTMQDSGRILSRCGGRLSVIDVGISRVYDGGHLAAWEVVGGDAAAIYPSAKQDLVDPPAPSLAGQ